MLANTLAGFGAAGSVVAGAGAGDTAFLPVGKAFSGLADLTGLLLTALGVVFKGALGVALGVVLGAVLAISLTGAFAMGLPTVFATVFAAFFATGFGAALVTALTVALTGALALASGFLTPTLGAAADFVLTTGLAVFLATGLAAAFFGAGFTTALPTGLAGALAADLTAILGLAEVLMAALLAGGVFFADFDVTACLLWEAASG